MTYLDLQSALKKKELSRIYCFCGNEQSQKNEAAALIASLIFASSNPLDHTIATYFAYENVELACRAAASVPLFGGSTLFIIKHCELAGVSKKTQAMLRDCLQTIPESSYIIFSTHENKPPALIPSDLHNDISIVQFYKPFEENFKSYILKKCKHLSLEINEDALNLLVEYTENDTKEIDDILSLISLSDTATITKDSVSGFAVHEREAIEFEFVDMFFLKDKRTWSLYLASSERTISPILLLSLLFTHAQKIESYHLKVSEGIPSDELMKELKIYGKRQKVFAKQTSIYPLDTIRSLISALYRYDMMLKSYRYEGLLQKNPLLDLILQYSS